MINHKIPTGATNYPHNVSLKGYAVQYTGDNLEEVSNFCLSLKMNRCEIKFHGKDVINYCHALYNKDGYLVDRGDLDVMVGQYVVAIESIQNEGEYDVYALEWARFYKFFGGKTNA